MILGLSDNLQPPPLLVLQTTQDRQIKTTHRTRTRPKKDPIATPAIFPGPQEGVVTLLVPAAELDAVGVRVLLVSEPVVVMLVGVDITSVEVVESDAGKTPLAPKN